MPKKQLIAPTRLHKSPAIAATRPSSEQSKPKNGVSVEVAIQKARASRLTKLAVIVLVVLAACFVSYHVGARSTGNNGAVPTGNLNTTDAVVQHVSRHILLPSGEQPTVATVSDVNKVRNQAFFAHAATGDKVLIYANAKKAYLYRPSIDRVIEVAPLAPSSSSQSSTSSPSTQPTGQ